MYPLDDGLTFPIQQCWVAARGDELGAGLLGRTLLEQEVVLYRTSEGEAVALQGRCPHPRTTSPRMRATSAAKTRRLSALYTYINHEVRLQDKVALELIEPAFKTARLQEERSGLQDGGGTRVRRLLTQQIREELGNHS